MRLDGKQLEDVRTTIRRRIEEGLRTDGEVISALPAFFGPPAPNAEGPCLVIDIGGTNMRAALVHVAPSGCRIVRGPLEERLTLREREHAPDAAGFFAMQAALAARLEVPPGLAVGYCFSYPSKTLPDRDAVLLRWTKNIDIPEVVGMRVGEGLRAALDEVGLRPGPVRVVNDTVAALLATAAVPGETRPGAWTPRNGIGLIVGTGTNMAAYFDATEAPKLAPHGAGPMAVNLESGNVDPPYLSSADDAVDAASSSPGRQRFEKAVSGYYLPYVFQACHPGYAFDPANGSAPLAALAESGPAGPEQETARALLARSADLVAASLAAVFDVVHTRPEPMMILAEGSLFWRTAGYRSRVTDRLAALTGPSCPFRVVRLEDANLLGAALAASAPE